MKQITLIAIAIIFIMATTLPAAAEEYKPGETFNGSKDKLCGNCPKMVVLPPGSFMMGSPAEEKGRDDNEGPYHKTTITYSFAVGVYEVTFNEWDYCVQQGGCPSYRPDDKGRGRGERPVINVLWHDAKSYVRWLSRKTKQSYRLLSEAEWEYAARAGTDTPFHFGNTISANQANYNGNYTYGSGERGKYRGKAIAAGSFPANKFGLHDMHGNVWEWVEDCWHESYKGAPTDGSAWIARGDCNERVIRGGSWNDKPGYLRSAHRYWGEAAKRTWQTALEMGWIAAPDVLIKHRECRDPVFGFRVALTLTPMNPDPHTSEDSGGCPPDYSSCPSFLAVSTNLQ